jgi:YidC/Oxa1 family membrane protein insertase
MRQYLPNVLVFLLLAAGLTAGWWYIDRTFFPKPEPKPPRELVQAIAGGAVGETLPARNGRPLSRPDVKEVEKPKEEKAKETKEPVKPVEPPKVSPSEPPELIALGTDTFNKRVLLTTRGAGIQQVKLQKTPFDEANRLGREVRRPDGSTIQRLRLIPGLTRKRAGTTLTDIHDNPDLDRLPDLVPGVVPPGMVPLLSEPSYVLLHYPAEDDPLRQSKEAGRMNDEYPSPELRDRTWTVVERHLPADGSEHRVVFETTLGAPYHLRLRKTFTLASNDYHVGFILEVIPEPGRVKGKGLFRYQIAGARGLPVEGEWYTYTYRNALVGWMTNKGGAKRAFEDAGSINTKHGGDEVRKGGPDTFGRFTYAAVVTQYFASALAIDETQSPTVMSGMWDYVRPTREPHPSDSPDQPFLSDITVRAVSSVLDPAPGEPVTHKYLIYNGPVKVRLLKMMPPGSEVDEGLVDRYLDQLTLKTMSDYHSPNFFGRVANAIWWADVVITFTNLMHSVLYGIHKYTGLPWGICIVLLTVCVRLALMIPSRKQQAMMIRMQEKMAKVKPEIDKLTEKFKDNPQLLQQEKARLMFKHGINPVSTMSGCLLLFAQMPIFMGLYFCLQESVFFRLEPLIPGLTAWAPNLSAPDMLVWWTEQIPWVASPENLGGAIYLGPFLNILPLLATGLIFIQQKISMPPPTDEMQEQQQKMMKFMILFMAVFFYKVPAGLCVYFICSTTWALLERKLIPKPKANLPDATGGPVDEAKPAVPGKPDDATPSNGDTGGGFLRRMKARLDEMQQKADEQASRQVRRDPPPPGGGREKKRKRKK